MLFASGVAIPPDLAASLRGIGGGGVQGVQNAYSPFAARQQQEDVARGQRPGSNSYGPQRLATQQGLDTGALEASFGNQVGNTAYQNQLSQRDYEQQRQLSEETAHLDKPSDLEQILAGIGTVGKTAGTYYGMKGRNPQSPGAPSQYNIQNTGTYYDPVLGQTYL